MPTPPSPFQHSQRTPPPAHTCRLRHQCTDILGTLQPCCRLHARGCRDGAQNVRVNAVATKSSLWMGWIRLGCITVMSARREALEGVKWPLVPPSAGSRLQSTILSKGANRRAICLLCVSVCLCVCVCVLVCLLTIVCVLHVVCVSVFGCIVFALVSVLVVPAAQAIRLHGLQILAPQHLFVQRCSRGACYKAKGREAGQSHRGCVAAVPCSGAGARAAAGVGDCFHWSRGRDRGRGVFYPPVFLFFSLRCGVPWGNTRNNRPIAMNYPPGAVQPPPVTAQPLSVTA